MSCSQFLFVHKVFLFDYQTLLFYLYFILAVSIVLASILEVLFLEYSHIAPQKFFFFPREEKNGPCNVRGEPLHCSYSLQHLGINIV